MTMSTTNKLVTILTVLLLSQSALAHFPWLTIGSEEGKVALFFGENPAERTYKLPPSIAKAQVMLVGDKGVASKVKLQEVDSDDFVGLKSSERLGNPARLATKVTYGLYHGSRLDYYAAHRAGPLPKDRKAYAAQQRSMDLQAQLVDTDSGVDVFVLWKGKPLGKAEVRLFCEEGHEEATAETDAMGKVSFSDAEVEDGLNGILVGHTLEKDHGELDGQTYESSSHYLTVTFVDPQDFEQRP